MVKSDLKELISFARYKDGMEDYRVCYRDFSRIKEISLSSFLELQEEEGIPLHRIHKISKNGQIKYLKHSCCRLCSMKVSPDNLNEDNVCTDCYNDLVMSYDG
ncbi:MAG: hypothetical protein ACTSP4_08775 [Candidatus Hodarchaeales archaeon]